LKPLSDESGQTVLKGKIRLLLIHVHRPFATGDVENLRLVPDPAKKGNWQIELGEVKRTGKAMN
jgi:hypothetical protein